MPKVRYGDLGNSSSLNNNVGVGIVRKLATLRAAAVSDSGSDVEVDQRIPIEKLLDNDIYFKKQEYVVSKKKIRENDNRLKSQFLKI
jgi:hypothetical protein